MKSYLNMGGNLNKIDEIFVRVPPKNKNNVDIVNMNKSSIEEEDNTKNSNDNSNVHVTGLLKNSACQRYWGKDNIDELNKMMDPASLHEKIYVTQTWCPIMIQSQHQVTFNISMVTMVLQEITSEENLQIKKFGMNMQRRKKNTDRIT